MSLGAVNHYVCFQTNTFQVLIASDGEDSFAGFLYPEGGIKWIKGEGKYAPQVRGEGKYAPQVRGQGKYAPQVRGEGKHVPR